MRGGNSNLKILSSATISLGPRCLALFVEIFYALFPGFSIPNVQKCANLVDLERFFGKMSTSTYVIAKIGIDTAENEPSKVL